MPGDTAKGCGGRACRNDHGKQIQRMIRRVWSNELQAVSARIRTRLTNSNAPVCLKAVRVTGIASPDFPQ
jgi:hypothetical protein